MSTSTPQKERGRHDMRHEGANSDGLLSDVIDQCPSPRFDLFDWTGSMGAEVPAEKSQLGPLVSCQTYRIHSGLSIAPRPLSRM